LLPFFTGELKVPRYFDIVSSGFIFVIFSYTCESLFGSVVVDL